MTIKRTKAHAPRAQKNTPLKSSSLEKGKVIKPLNWIIRIKKGRKE